MRALLVLLALVIVVLPGTSSAARGSGTARLTISVWPQGRGEDKPVRRWTLTCRPAGGSHPAPVRACRRLFANLGALRAIPSDRVCAEVFGGPQVALIRGRVNGRRVRSSFNRADGCEIRRWNAMGVVLPVSTRPARPDPPTRLEINFTPTPDGPTRTVTLTCDPAGGTLPNAAEACRRLAAFNDPFAPIPRGAVCATIWGGPQRATVTGTFRGKPVDAAFDRTNGCEIERWDRIAFLFETG